MNPSVATIFLTRKCNYHCESCGIRRNDSKDQPYSYWIEVALALRDEFNIHVNFYGGEPLCYSEFFELIDNLGYYNINYSVNSSSYPMGAGDAANLVRLGLRNWTSSVDNLRDIRSIVGLNYLKSFKEYGVPDLMAEIVVFPGKVDEAREVCQELMKDDFWVSVTFLSYGLSKNYDSFPRIKPEWSSEDIEKISLLRDEVKNYPKLHGNDPNYLIAWDRDEFLYQELKPCGGELISFHPDCDGRMRLCRDIAGKRVKKWNALDAIASYEKFLDDWRKDYEELCLGCNWSCMFWSRGMKEEIKHELSQQKSN